MSSEQRQMVEREEQLTVLRARYADAAAGAGQVGLVDGGVASGKTELANAAARHAEAAGALVLTATGSVAENGIPLGVVGQLFHSARTQGHDRARLPGPVPAALEVATLAPSDARLLDDICAVLLDLAAARPLVLVVDDVQFVDCLSAQALLYLQRRIRAARVLLVLSGCVAARAAGSALHAELTKQPHCTYLRLLPLSRAGITALLGTRLPAGVAARLSAPAHLLSGGSPVLAHALVDDVLAAPAEPGEAVVGVSFLQAALSCLHRSDPRLLDVARAFAVFDQDTDPATDPEAIAAVAGLDTASARLALEALTTAGLLHGGSFVHPEVRAAVLADCPVAVHARLRRRAAARLHAAAAPATEIAAHLVAAGEAEPWAAPVLLAAAGDATATGDTVRALSILELALGCVEDHTCRAAVLAALVRAHWRHNPAGAVRYLTPLLTAAHDGHLGTTDTLLLVRALAWHGRAGEAAEVLVRAGDPAGPGDPHLAADHRSTVAWLRLCDPDAPPAADPSESDVDHAEALLQRAHVDHSVLAGVWCALRTLIDADRFDLATHWCTRLLAGAQTHDAPTWRAVLSDVRAAIALRQGDLAVAKDHARAALSALPAPGWGVAVGSPLSHLALAGAATGDLAGAEEALRLTTPPAMRRSLFWVEYLRARGVYYEAVDRPHAALAEFAAVGAHAARWPAHATSSLPWRVDLARIHVRLGRDEEACGLIAEHLALPAETVLRGRGMALRVLAAARPPRQRMAILREATELLHASGDRHELAHVFADLSETGHALGEFGRAKMMGRRALQLATRCHAEPLRRRLHLVFDEPEQREEPHANVFAALSEAERRVVDLAARGHTNREIGHKLFITVSTVEQHLTRAYRKLKVSRRTDLVAVELPEEAGA